MDEDDNIHGSLKKLLVDLAGVPESKLHPDAEMMHDLGIDGADAAEFMTAFAREFRVDMSLFKFDIYFGPEAGFDPFRWLYRKVSKAPTIFVPMTLRDLESVAVLKMASNWVIASEAQSRLASWSRPGSSFVRISLGRHYVKFGIGQPDRVHEGTICENCERDCAGEVIPGPCSSARQF